LSTGRELSLVDHETAALACKQWREYPQFADLHMNALLEILDEQEPEYRK
jgi:hypothetical protein